MYGAASSAVAYTQRIALAPGSRIGAYEVVSALGQGGMGEVYRAKDSKLKRDVALKVLPADVATDRERLARFQREAEVLASLNHPHIAHIHGIEESGTTVALIMELVEGEDLSQRIARGAIPIGDALPIARQIAEALEAAHERGIIHRDLKPANIKVQDDGTVKVLDFGLAKTADRADAESAGMMTITSPAMTMRGMILGTAAYMAPEQAKGKAVDRRADVWAFGAVLYEMLTGQRAFKGDDITDTIAAVVSKEPDWPALPAATPAAIHTLLRRCLAKDRKRRLDSAADARLEIEDALNAPAMPDAAAAPSASRLPWAIAAIAVAALIAAIAIGFPRTPVPAPPEARLDVVTAATDSPTLFALSPDGRYVAYIARSDGAARLWLRALDSTVARPLPGTEGAGAPFWSPDSRSIAFIALNANALKRIDIDGGLPQTLAPAAVSRGGAWLADGVILYVPSATGPLMRVSASGGASAVIPMADSRHQSNRWPMALPDGRRYLFFAQGPQDTAGIYLGSIDSPTSTRLTPAASNGAYLAGAPGWLFWVRGGALVAQRLDLDSAKLTGDVVTIADSVMVQDVYGHSALSASATGIVAYRAGSTKRRQLTWFDRSGAMRGVLGEPHLGMRNPVLSPDGSRAVVARMDGGNEDIWLVDTARSTRLTFDAANDSMPTWSPDGRRITFRSNRRGSGDIYEKAVSGAAPEQVVFASSETSTPQGWSPDGRTLLLMTTIVQQSDYNIQALVGGARTPVPLVHTPFREMWGLVSPDGRWLAYMSDQSGRNEVYVRPYSAQGQANSGEAPDGEWQVSTAGGGFPVWRRDSRELYYLTTNGELIAASIAVAGATLQPGVPVKLFRSSIFGGGTEVGIGRQFDVAPDGRFLINLELDDTLEPIRLLLNWKP